MQARPVGQGNKRKNRRRKQRRLQPEQKEARVAVGKAWAYGKVRKEMSMFSEQGASLARQMAIPEASEALLRLPTVDMPRTAITRLTTTTTISTSDCPPNTYPTLWNGSGDLLVYVYGLPGLSYMYGPVRHVGAAVDARVHSFGYSADGTVYAQTLNYAKIPPGANVTVPWEPSWGMDGYTNSSTPLGISGGRTYAWFDSSEKMRFTLLKAGVKSVTPGPLTVTIFAWKGPGEPARVVRQLTYDKAQAGSDQFSVNAERPSWYSFEFTIGAMDTDTITETILIEVDGVARYENPARMLFHYQSDMLVKDVSESIRRTGFSLLCTNTSAEINQQGTVVAARLVNDGFYDEDSSMNVLHLAKASDKYTGKAAHGVYTYMDFEQVNERFDQAVVGETSRFALGPQFNLDNYGYVHVIKITNPNPTTLANDYLLTCTAIYEFRTDSMLYNKTVPMMSHDALVEARRINNATPYFYENPLHFSDIWNGIKSAFAIVRRAATPIGAVASTYFPEMSPAIMGMAHALQS